HLAQCRSLERRGYLGVNRLDRRQDRHVRLGNPQHMGEVDGVEALVEMLARYSRRIKYPSPRDAVLAVEVGTPGVGRRDRAEDLGVLSPAGDQQLEQDRASNVLPYHRELAGAAAGES